MADQPLGHITEILVSSVAGAPMQSVASVEAVANRGLAGDRYFLGVGYYSGKPGWGASVTLMESEAIAAINAGHGTTISAAYLRRNIVTAGFKVDSLIGRDFRCGGAVFRGIKAFPPCSYLARLLGDPAILRYLAYCGGIGAEVLQTGPISVDDEIMVI